MYYRGYVSRGEIRSGFTKACRAGHLETAQWLMKASNGIILLDSALLSQVCGDGHVDVVKWMCEYHSFSPREIVWAFASACMRGQLCVAQWLYEANKHVLEDRPFPVDGPRPEVIFAMACESERLETAQWLYTLVYITDLHKNAAIDVATRNGHTEVVDWLNSKK
jgi:hypothetical protein